MPATAATPKFITATFDQLEEPGPASCPGLKVGDVMISLSCTDTSGPFGNSGLMSLGLFEAVVTADDEVQQNISTTSPGSTFTAVFLRI